MPPRTRSTCGVGSGAGVRSVLGCFHRRRRLRVEERLDRHVGKRALVEAELVDVAPPEVGPPRRTSRRSETGGTDNERTGRVESTGEGAGAETLDALLLPVDIQPDLASGRVIDGDQMR